jgi:hypothetical protein
VKTEESRRPAPELIYAKAEELDSREDIDEPEFTKCSGAMLWLAAGVMVLGAVMLLTVSVVVASVVVGWL